MDLTEYYTLSRHYLTTQNQAYHRNTLPDTLFSHRLSVLVGQRGVGKTTLIVQHLLSMVQEDVLSPKILYVPADHFLIGGTALYEIAEHFQQLGGEIIAFDEIHKYANWSADLKSIYDTFPTLRIIASGSSALEIYKGSHDLTRRAIVHEIVGFSFREYLELTQDIRFEPYPLDRLLQQHESLSSEVLHRLEAQHQKVLVHFKQYLKTGYYPYARELKDQQLYWMTLEQNIHTTIDSDLSAIFPSLTGASIRKLKQLLSFIASAVPFVPNLQKLKQLLHIGDERTLKNYLKYLEDARLIRQLKAASSKLQQLEIPEKIYLDNPNQLYAISKERENIGTVRELFFLDMLSYQYEVSAPKQGDFLVDHSYLFEIGGKNKKSPSDKNVFLACDDIEHGANMKIPLWLFGFLY